MRVVSDAKRGPAGWRRHGLSALAGAFAALMGAGPVRAQEAATLPPGLEAAPLLPDHAAAFAAVRPLDVADGFAFLDLVAGLSPGMGAELARIRKVVGLEAWSRAEVTGKGLDPGAPLLVAWGSVDESGWKDPAGPMARHRVALKATDPARLETWVAGMLERLGLSVAKTDAGKQPKFFAAWKSLAKKTGVTVAAEGPDGTLIFVRRAGAFLLVDVAEPLRPGAKPAQKRAQTRAGTAMLETPEAPTGRRGKAPRPTLADTLAAGSRRALGDEDASAVVVLSPEGLVSLLPDEGCRARVRDADGAWFEDLAAVARLRPFEWRVRLLAAPTALGKKSLGPAGADDGLMDVRQLAASGLGALALYLPSAAVLRATPPPASLRQPFSQTMAALQSCGGTAPLVALLRHGPQLLGALAEERAGVIGTPALATEARNLAAVLRPMPSTTNGFELQTTWLASFSSERSQGLEQALGRAAEVPPEKVAFGNRTPTTYVLKQGDVRAAGLESLPGARVGLAFTSDERGLDFYYSTPRRPAVFGSRGRLGSLHLNVGSYLEHEAQRADEATLAAVRLAAQQIGMMGGDLYWDADGLLRLDLELGGTP